MTDLHPTVSPETSSSQLDAKLRLLESWSWWLWGAAIVILVMISFSLRPQERILLATVLLFSAFAVYQQVMANRLRRQIAAERIAELSDRTTLLEELSMIDPLTGLFNRRFAAQRLPHELARAARLKIPLTVLMLDLDNFKAINDGFGHGAGDCALQGFALKLRESVRASDLPVRYGGDEFLVLLPDCFPDDITMPLERLRAHAVEIGGAHIPLEFSAGWAQSLGDESPEVLLQHADAALYRAKAEQRATRDRRPN